MMDEFKIFIDRLRDGHVESIDFTISPDFLAVKEKDLEFNDPVHISGEAYETDSELVLNLEIKTTVMLPCSICNKQTPFELVIPKFYFMKPLEEIPSHIYDFSSEVREAILLEVPFVVECSGGRCPSRKELEKFLAPPKDSEDDGWQPFKDL